jgi:hypothetical protein
MCDDTREILKKIQNKKTLDTISRELKMRKTMLKARVDFLIYQGFLGEIYYKSGCTMCPMNCRSGDCCPDIKMLALTEKGKKLISHQ